MMRSKGTMVQDDQIQTSSYSGSSYISSPEQTFPNTDVNINPANTILSSNTPSVPLSSIGLGDIQPSSTIVSAISDMTLQTEASQMPYKSLGLDVLPSVISQSTSIQDLSDDSSSVPTFVGTSSLSLSAVTPEMASSESLSSFVSVLLQEMPSSTVYDIIPETELHPSVSSEIVSQARSSIPVDTIETVSLYSSESLSSSYSELVLETGSASSTIDASASTTLDLNSLYASDIHSNEHSIASSHYESIDILPTESSSEILTPSSLSSEYSSENQSSFSIPTLVSSESLTQESMYSFEYLSNLIPSISTEIFDSFSYSTQSEYSVYSTDFLSEIFTSEVSSVDSSGEITYSDTPSLVISIVNTETLPDSTSINLAQSTTLVIAASSTISVASSSSIGNVTLPVPEKNTGGLSKGGKAALGICIPIILIAIIAAIVYFAYKRRYHSATWKLSEVVSYRPWSYNNATYYDDESTLIIPSLDK